MLSYCRGMIWPLPHWPSLIQRNLRLGPGSPIVHYLYPYSLEKV